MSQTNEQIIQQYVGLLIQQYCGQTNVQTITFNGIPISGTFQFTYGTQLSNSLPYNATTNQMEAAIQTISGVASVSVTSSTNTSGNQVLTVVFGVPAVPPTLILGTIGTLLVDGSSNEITSVTSGNLLKAAMMIQALSRLNVMCQLPLAVQDAFNLLPTIQTITFSSAPTSGAFTLSFSVTSTPTQDATSTASISFDDSNLAIKNAINAILPSGSCSVSGGLGTGAITVSFVGVNPSIITVETNTTGIATAVTSNLAQGTQLDVLGKYLGITRNGFNQNGAVVLDDTDFYQLILLAIIRNNSGSSLDQIQTLLFNFFHGAILVFDYQNMQMSYVVNTSLLSNSLLSCFISQNLLPKPMGVQLASIIGGPDPTAFFSFRTYLIPSSGSPFNTYDSYNLSYPWVTYSDVVV